MSELIVTQRLHDLRGSLQVILGFLQWMDARDFGPEGQDLLEASRVSMTRVMACLEEIHTALQQLPAASCQLPHRVRRVKA